MRIKQLRYKDEDAIIIYVTKKEYNTEKVKIKNYKSKYKHAAVFISGENSIEKAIYQIIKDQIEER